MGRNEQLVELGLPALVRDGLEPRRALGRCRRRVVGGAVVETGRKAGNAEDTERVVAQDDAGALEPAARHLEFAGCDGLATAEEVDDGAVAAQRHRVDGEVAADEVGLERGAEGDLRLTAAHGVALIGPIGGQFERLPRMDGGDGAEADARGEEAEPVLLQDVDGLLGQGRGGEVDIQFGGERRRGDEVAYRAAHDDKLLSFSLEEAEEPGVAAEQLLDGLCFVVGHKKRGCPIGMGCKPGSVPA